MKVIEIKPSNICDFVYEREKAGMIQHGRVEKNLDLLWSVASYKDAMHRAEHGCAGCAERIKENFLALARKSSNWGIDISLPNDYEGPALDPGALSMGIPECCVYPNITKKHILGDQGLDIIVNIVVSCGVGTDVMRARGVLASAIVLIAEKLEISTRIIIGCAVKRNHEGSDFAVILKDYAQPLDLPLVAFWLISPAASRIVSFALFDAVDKTSYENYHYYPSNTSYKSYRKKQIIIDHGYLRKEMLDPKKAVESALSILRANGVIK